jgi:hypothetical protein
MSLWDAFIAMSLWDAFIDDYERRRRDLLKRIELMDLPQTGKSELGRWITTTADSLEQAKTDLAEIERLLRPMRAMQPFHSRTNSKRSFRIP